MPTWPALLLAPLLALADLCTVYALTSGECAQQRVAPVHAASAVYLALTLLFTLMAALQARQLAQRRRGAPGDTDEAGAREWFVARVASWSGALSTLVIAAMWLPAWLLMPCIG